MIGSIRWNVTFAIVAGLLSFWVALSSNLLITALIRGLTGFVITFILMFLFRWLLALIIQDGSTDQSEQQMQDLQPGMNIDLITPVEDEQWDMNDAADVTNPSSTNESPVFQAFEPPRLVLKKQPEVTQDLDPKTAARAIRRLTED